MCNKVILTFICFLPLISYSQEPKTEKEVEKLKTVIPVQAQYSNKFELKDVYFNKRIDIGGRGEVLHIQFKMRNLTDDPQDLYIFTIATYENKPKSLSSREDYIPPQERIKNFIPYPHDIQNFEYQPTDKNDRLWKSADGKSMVTLVKYPKNPKAGVDPVTGKPYRLARELIVDTTHLSKFKVNYTFFNEIALLIFDSEGKPAFRQLYSIIGKRG